MVRLRTMLYTDGMKPVNKSRCAQNVTSSFNILSRNVSIYNDSNKKGIWSRSRQHYGDVKCTVVFGQNLKKSK